MVSLSPWHNVTLFVPLELLHSLTDSFIISCVATRFNAAHTRKLAARRGIMDLGLVSLLFLVPFFVLAVIVLLMRRNSRR